MEEPLGGSTGVSIKRVARYTASGRVETVTDTFSSIDGAAHSLDLMYEDDLQNSAAGWELPGQTSFQNVISGAAGPFQTGPGTVYAIDNIAGAPGLTNPIGALTFSAPYKYVNVSGVVGATEPNKRRPDSRGQRRKVHAHDQAAGQEAQVALARR